MADDVNKSRRPINGKSPVQAAIEKYSTGQEKESAFIEAMHENYGYPLEQELKSLQRDPMGNLDAILKTKERMGAYQAQEQRALTEASHKNKYSLVNSVSSAIGHRQERSLISQHRQSAFTAPTAISRGSSANPFDVEREARGLEGSITASRERMMGFAKNEDVNSLSSEDAKYQGLLRKKGQVEAVQGFLSKSGRDVTSQYLGAEQALKGGVPRGLGDAEKALREFVTALKEGKEVTKEEFAAKEKAIKQIENHQRQSRRMGQAGQIVGQAGGAIVNLGQRVAVGMQVEGQQMAAQYADWENRKFNDTRSGVRNLDFAAMRRLGGAYGGAEQFGSRLETRANIAFGLGKTVAATASGMQAVGSGIGVVGGGAGDAIGHGVNAAIHTAEGALELGAGLIGGRAGMQGRESHLQRTDAYNYARDSVRNAAGRYQSNQALATRGLGSGREGAINSFDTQGGLRRLAGVGIDADQAISLTASGVGALGGAFGGYNDVYKAGAAQRAGMVSSADQYMGMRGQLANVGSSGAGNLEKVMRNAVAAGMDNSKNIAQMVSATASLSRGSAMMGVSTGSAVSGTIGGINQMLTGTDKNIRTDVAARAMSVANNYAEDQSMNIFNFAERAQLRSIPGINGNQYAEEAAARLTPDQIKALGGATGAARTAMARKLGIGAIDTAEGGISDGTIGRLGDITQRNVLNKMAGGFQDAGMVSDMMSLMKSKGFGTKMQNFNAGKSGSGADLFDSGELDLMNNFGGAGAMSKVSGSAAFLASGAFEGSQGAVVVNGTKTKAAEDIKGAQSTNKAIEIGMGRDSLGGADNVLNSTLQQVNQINKNFEEAGISFLTKAKEAGERFDRSDTMFEQSVQDFGAYVTQLLSSINSNKKVYKQPGPNKLRLKDQPFNNKKK